jgi:hypothetical protein
MELAIPGFGRLSLEHLVLDYNGTLAVDGKLLPGVKARLARLSGMLRIHVVTADTFGKARAGLRGLDCRLEILQGGAEDPPRPRMSGGSGHAMSHASVMGVTTGACFTLRASA